ncbi:expressed unknown protein [Seminavis robusta]|uniref:EF-hand domain-containing protein n=1 Tax=Seminavis robusta TaxID=568900 RepID=A0A9N8EFY1_9STRA|nr:expressed unknown protein [Seminavis robusta]|eukprot:Sro934_g221820.1 n/a (263) ;mRNA; r:10935-11723
MKFSYAITTMAMSLSFVSSNGFVVLPQQPSTSTAVASMVTTAAHVRRAHSYEESPSTVFDRMDKDGNGKVDAQEMRDYLVDTGVCTDAVAKSIFSRLSRHGHVDVKQLECAMTQHNLLRQQQPPAQVTFPIQTKTVVKNNNNNNKRRNNKTDKIKMYHQQAKQFFEALDVNRDGFISLQELQQHFIVKRMELVAQKSSGLFADNAKKHKSVKRPDLLLAEYSEAALQKLFQTIDMNADGRISLQDLREAFVRYPSVRHAFQS